MRANRAFRPPAGPCLEHLEPRLLLSAASPLAATAESYASAAVIVPLQIEQESLGGPGNDELLSAEALSFSYLVPNVSPEDGTGPQQAAVSGVGEGAAGPGYDATSTVFATLYGGRSASVPMLGLTPPGGDGVLTINAGADLTGADKYLTLRADDMELGALFVLDEQSGGGSSPQLILTQEQLAELAADGTVTFTFTASPAMQWSGTNYVQVRLAYPGPSGGDADYYSFELGSGESASLAVGGAGEFTLDLYSAGGEAVASAEMSEPGAVTAIEDFLATAGGTYYVKVAGSGEYTLVVDRNATMDTGANDALDAAQAVVSPSVAGRQWVIGEIDGAADADMYRLPLSSGVLNVRAATPAAEGDLNELAPILRLYDSTGELVAVSEDGRLQVHLPKGADGDYVLEIVGADATAGDYVLSVQGSVEDSRGKAPEDPTPGTPGRAGEHPLQAQGSKDTKGNSKN